jgi:PhnB protein
MLSLNPYLNFNGTAEQAFNFYKSVFGGEFTGLQRFKDTPEASKIPAEASDKIMHISLPIGKGIVLMASDSMASMGGAVTVGNNIHLNINAESEDEANKLFNGLSAGGEIKMPLAKTFWGAYFGMFADKFGIHWMINYDYNQRSQS